MSDTELLEHLARAARAAGARILELYERGCDVWDKPDRSPVTEADLAAEAIILAALAIVAPGTPVVAEEAVAAGRIPDIARRFFLVDALDGTRDFIARGRDFTVNIGLIEDGAPSLGVVQVPIDGTVYAGIVGQDPMKTRAWRDRDGVRAAIHVRDVPPAGPTALISRSHLTAPTIAWLDARGVTDRQAVGSSLKYCLVAAGEADLSVRHGPTSEWDTAAAHAVLLAAGGRMETHDGMPLRYGKPGFGNPGLVAWGGSLRKPE